MTPFKDRGQGSWILDLTLGKLGRYKASSGTSDPKLFQDVRQTIRLLRKHRRWDVLALLVNKHIGPLELHDAFVRGDLTDLPTADDVRPLAPTVSRWLDDLDRKASTRKHYGWLLKHLGDGRLGNVPTLLAEARRGALKSGKRSMFNDLLSATRQFMLWAVDKIETHPLYLAVNRIEAVRVERRKGNPLTPDEARKLAQDLGPMIWDLCLTGMRRGEYFGRRYDVRPDRILIHGTKTKAAERTVFKAYPIGHPLCSYDHFRQKLSAHGLWTHDMRYTFMRWAGNAGIPWQHIKWYVGHSAGDVSETYFQGRGFTEDLHTDAKRFREFLGDIEAQGLAVVK